MSRRRVTGNTKASLKIESNLFWLEQRTEEWKKGRDQTGKWQCAQLVETIYLS